MKRHRTFLSGSLAVAGCVLLMGLDCGGRDCVEGGTVHHSGDTFPSDDGCNTCSCENGAVACTLRACAPQWWKSCGDPVCSGHRADPNIPACTTEKLGDPCNTPGKQCDINDSCNVHLVCANSDPTKQTGGCPISRARWKADIRYLDDPELARYQQQLLDLRLATWRYKSQPAGSPTQLGFIIDDVGDGPAVNPDGESVNLYGYTSMAVATLQLQAAEIARLKDQVAALSKQVAAAARPAATTPPVAERATRRR